MRLVALHLLEGREERVGIVQPDDEAGAGGQILVTPRPRCCTANGPIETVFCFLFLVRKSSASCLRLL